MHKQMQTHILLQVLTMCLLYKYPLQLNSTKLLQSVFDNYALQPYSIYVHYICLLQPLPINLLYNLSPLVDSTCNIYNPFQLANTPNVL
ncbi:uncharacterized protein BX663DRAFT_491445 [Cokeromyces recurvatus]|uniref:uncharacterized protein n=1 Tax=Cokeromyces recurvatus TaxID=90255 RepID=UPI00221E4883|nr:uncharacterized protein BX663DRAFT_491445 [Cokeromyces recurvatus]KAI7907611.1 hypothetical protein BX663DRAFT_491445 [Cokeromyces recurvatus]